MILCSRDGKNDLDLTEHRVHLGTGGAAIKILDLETGEARPSTLKDLYQLGRLVDQLENIHFFLRPCIPTDIPGAAYDVNVFYTCLKATGKHVMAGVNDVGGFHKVLDLAAMVAGGPEKLRGNPIISVITSFAISPLKLDTQTTLIMQEAVRNRIPVALSCAPMAGSTSPVTMAGTLALIHAEQLAGITPRSPFEEACRRLGIQVFVARSPQAKGRVERNHGVYQDRFVKELRLAGISDIASANECLCSTYINEINAKFAESPVDPQDAHVPLLPNQCLSNYLCFTAPRVVSEDYVVQFEQTLYQIQRQKRHRLPAPGSQVMVHKWLDATVHIFTNDGKELLTQQIVRPTKEEEDESTPA